MPSTRTIARCLAVLPLVFVFFLSGATGSARAADTATVTVDLNLRTGPSTDFDILRIMPAGSTVTLTGEESDDFYGVIFDDVQGWAYGGALDFGTAAPAPTPSPAPSATPVPSATPAPSATPEPTANATVVVEALNVRAAPGLDGALVAVLAQGARVEIVGGPEEVDGFTWLEVSGAGGIQGWVAGEFLLGDQ
jgi:uncharacterized protein YraI